MRELDIGGRHIWVILSRTDDDLNYLEPMDKGYVRIQECFQTMAIAAHGENGSKGRFCTEVGPSPNSFMQNSVITMLFAILRAVFGILIQHIWHFQWEFWGRISSFAAILISCVNFVYVHQADIADHRFYRVQNSFLCYVISAFSLYYDDPGGFIPSWVINWAAKVCRWFRIDNSYKWMHLQAVTVLSSCIYHNNDYWIVNCCNYPWPCKKNFRKYERISLGFVWWSCIVFYCLSALLEFLFVWCFVWM